MTEKNYIHLDCSKMNAQAVIGLSADIVTLIKERYGGAPEPLVKMTMSAQKG